MHDQVAIVTGASRGIGAAIAKRLGEDGFRVVVNYSGSEQKANDVVGMITEAGGEAIAVKADVSNAEAGRIINIASVVGITGNAGLANYAAAKAGLIGLTKSVARELAGRHVTVNAVCPGFIQTDMTDALTDAQREATLEQIPFNRFGQVEDVANLVSFLASEQAAYVTGQTIAVDGGMTMA